MLFQSCFRKITFLAFNFLELAFATIKASTLESVPITLRFLFSNPSEIEIIPEPIPNSNKSFPSKSYSKIFSTIISLSGLGTNTDGLT